MDEYTEVQDESCHRYVIPFNMLEDWNKFLEFDPDNEAAWDVPPYAHQIDGGTLVFKDYRIG